MSSIYVGISTQNDTIIPLKEEPRIKFNITTNIYILIPQSFQKIVKNKYFDSPMLFGNFIHDNMKLYYYKIIDYWIDIRKKKKYIKTNYDIVKDSSI